MLYFITTARIYACVVVRSTVLLKFLSLLDVKILMYTENGSKNRSGGLYQLKVENKCVPLMANAQLGTRCHVYLIDLYISKLPEKAREMDCFYMKPLGDHVVTTTKPWFSAQPYGENKLMGMVKSMFESIGVTGKTNHSLRASGATEMFRAGVPEKIIQERTGHRSLKALRLYERTTANQHLSVANVLSSPSDVKFSGEQHDSKHCGSDNLSLSSIIGTASHCVINVNMTTPAVQKEKKEVVLQREVEFDI